MNMKTLNVTMCAALLAVSGAAWAQDKVDGKQVYETFQCGQCHGADARTPQRANTPRLAGLDSRYVADKTRQMVEKMAHKDVVGTCGEMPTKAQIQAIADWVSRLPN